ncbi:hypothetical protein ID866_11626 [Astraeus odoratus]|nr:hypothetical protein ID866_11626 [Astraeus odoratus]
MSTCKSSTTMGTPAMKVVNWTKVADEELVTDIDDTDLAEEVEKCWKEEERHQREAEAEQKWKDKERKQATAAEARKWQQADLEVQATGVKRQLACGSYMKAKERCKWPEVEMMAKKVDDNDDNNEIVILSDRKTKWPGGSKSLKEISDRQWGELIQVVFIANSHLEKIASAAQSNECKMQWHFTLMEGLVGQQQMLLSRLVKIASTAGSGGSKEVTKDQEEPQEVLGEGLGGQEGTGGVPGGVLEDELEDVPGNEPENGAGAEDGAGQEAQKKDKGKGKEKAL